MSVRGAVLILLLGTSSAQNLSVGFAGGAAVTNAFQTWNAGLPGTFTSYSQSKDYLVGLTLEYRLLGNLSIEGDAVYRELHLTVAYVEPNLTLYAVSPSPVVTWELPLMAKYRFHWAKAEPFVEAGPAFRPTTNLNADPSHYGATAGAGVALPWRQLEFTPMVRYSHWAPDARGPLSGSTESKTDQVELLLGVSGRPRSAWHPLSSRIFLGVTVGSTLRHDVPSTAYATGSYTFLIGPELEAALAKRLSLELDAVYHPVDATFHASVTERIGNTFEFPVLLRYKFGAGRWRPFVDAGPSFRLVVEDSSVVGVSAGGGVELRLRSLKIAPGVRFTHWRPQGVHDPAKGVIVNQVEFLTGFLL